MPIRLNGPIAVLSNSPDTVALVELALNQAGYSVVKAPPRDIKDGAIDLEHFMRRHRPAAILYDVAVPYIQQWEYCKHLRAQPALAEIPFVLITPNASQVRLLVGPDEALCEVIGRTPDLAELVDKVRAVVPSTERTV